MEGQSVNSLAPLGAPVAPAGPRPKGFLGVRREILSSFSEGFSPFLRRFPILSTDYPVTPRIGAQRG